MFWILTLCTELNAKDVLIINYTVHEACTSIAFWDVTGILYWKLTSFLCLMPSYAFAIGNVRMYLRIEPKTRTNRRFSKTRPDARTKAKKEDMSGETRTCDNPRGRRSTALSSKRMQWHVNSQCTRSRAEQTCWWCALWCITTISASLWLASQRKW